MKMEFRILVKRGKPLTPVSEGILYYKNGYAWGTVTLQVRTIVTCQDCGYENAETEWQDIPVEEKE